MEDQRPRKRIVALITFHAIETSRQGVKKLNLAFKITFRLSSILVN